MFTSLLQFIRVKSRSKAVLVGVGAAAILALAGGWALAGFIPGHGPAGRDSLTSARLGADPSAGSTVDGKAPQGTGPQAGDPQGTNLAGDPVGPDGSKKHFARSSHRSTTCPAPGSTVHGGLVVDGTCTTNSVTINGGILITGTGHLTLYKSTVNGGTSVRPGGEFDSNLPVMTGGGNTLNGGVTADHAFDMDIFNSTVQGRVVFDGGPSSVTTFEICGTNLQGDLTLENLSSNGAEIGDVILTNCANTISGSVRIVNDDSSAVELEKDTIGGSVEIFSSRPSLTDNTIGGSLLCHKGSSLALYDPDDTNSNQVHGTNTCA